MPKTCIEVPEIGPVYITKKHGQRSLRLRVDAKGQVQVSMPWISSRKTAIDFVNAKRDWIAEQQLMHQFKPRNGMLFGKGLRLIIMQHSKSVRTKQVGKNLFVYFNDAYSATNEQEAKIEKAIMHALRNEAEQFLLPRLEELAQLYGFSYNSSGIKRVVGRWGSCDSRQHISLSLYLIQLPIELIDYVLIHELSHTRHMNHSPQFWKQVEQCEPEYKLLKKRLREIQPRIYDAQAFMS